MDPTSVLAELRSAERPRLVLWPDREAAPASVALLAGSFDPVTNAHLELARAASREVDLVVLTYSVRTLPKEPGAAGPLLSEAERLRVLAAVCETRPGLAVGLCSHGLLGDQAAAAGERFPGARISVVLGSDKLVQLFDPRWYEDRDAALGELFRTAEVRYAVRAGEEVDATLAAAASLGHAASIEPLDADPRVAAISSRAVRELARSARDVSGLVPEEALAAVTEAVDRERRGRA
jgi:cytidyltransferase-like protein